MELLIPDWKGLPANVGALTTLRRGGISPAPYDDGCGGGGLNLGDHVGDAPEHVAHNRSLLNRLLPSTPTWLAQVHGTHVVDVTVVQGVTEADAAISTQRGAACAIMTADCLPVLLCDTAGRVVGAAHAGWRGLVEGVIENTVSAMRQAGAVEITAWLGPAIGPQKFEVGREVREAFVARQPEAESAFLPALTEGKYLADIYALARQRLQALNIDKIYGGDFCTVADRLRFYSYRRDKTTGRMATLIWLK
jgi:YfiH family protein